MHEKIQRLNKRAKQYDLTVIQVPTLPNRNEINIFSSVFTLCKASNTLMQYLFSYDFMWIYTGFYLIDKYPTKRNYIHKSGVSFISIDKKSENSIVWKDNSAVSTNVDTKNRDAVFKRAFGTFTCLEIIIDIVCNNKIFGCNGKKHCFGNLNLISNKSLPVKYKCDYQSVSTDCVQGDTCDGMYFTLLL